MDTCFRKNEFNLLVSYPYRKKHQFVSYITSFLKITSNEIMALNVDIKTIKLLVENIEEWFEYFEFQIIFYM